MVRLMTAKSKAKAKKSTASSVFEFAARRERAQVEWRRVEHEDHESWTVHALFGYFTHLYMERHHSWRLSALGGVEVVRALRTLAKREGMAEAVLAVEAVFKQKWIDGRHWLFLVDRDKYAKYVHPHIDRGGGGEQAEWKGTRNFKARKNIPAAEFFGR